MRTLIRRIHHEYHARHLSKRGHRRPRLFRDARGYFFESSHREFGERFVRGGFRPDNESRSTCGCCGGFYFQRPPMLSRSWFGACAGGSGRRGGHPPGSPTYGRHVAVELTEDNHLQLFIPRGFAHGFAVLSEEAVFQYKCDDYYAPEAEDGIAWDDPSLGIDWRIPEEKIILSEKGPPPFPAVDGGRVRIRRGRALLINDDRISWTIRIMETGNGWKE